MKLNMNIDHHILQEDEILRCAQDDMVKQLRGCVSPSIMNINTYYEH